MPNYLNNVIAPVDLQEENGLAAMAPPPAVPQKFIIAGQEYYAMPPSWQADPSYVPPPASETWKKAVSTGIDFMPGPGDIKSAQEAVTGKNLITDEPLAWWERGLAGAGALPLIPNVAGLLGGAKAAFRQKGLSNAVEMASKGHNVEDIWQKTGWLKGPEGKWRFEIDDEKLKLKPNNRDFGKLSDFVDHPDLFKQYPEAKDISVRWDRTREGASFSPEGNMIEIGTGNKDLKETFVHEIQHAIQVKEGFAKGGSPSEFIAGYRSVVRDLEEQIDAINNRLRKVMGTPKYDELITLRQELVNEVNKIQGDYGIGVREKGHEEYRRLHGEFESRDSASRMRWNPEMRKAVRPYSSELEPKGGWIVRQ